MSSARDTPTAAPHGPTIHIAMDLRAGRSTLRSNRIPAYEWSVDDETDLQLTPLRSSRFEECLLGVLKGVLRGQVRSDQLREH